MYRRGDHLRAASSAYPAEPTAWHKVTLWRRQIIIMCRVSRRYTVERIHTWLYYKTNMIYHRVVWGDVFQRKYSVILLSLSAPSGVRLTYTRTTYYYSSAVWDTCAVCVRKAAAVVYLLRARAHHINPVYTARALPPDRPGPEPAYTTFIIIYVLSISFADL